MKMYIITKQELHGIDFELVDSFEDHEVDKVICSGTPDQMITIATHVINTLPRNENGLFVSEQDVVDAFYDALEDNVQDNDDTVKVSVLIKSLDL